MRVCFHIAPPRDFAHTKRPRPRYSAASAEASKATVFERRARRFRACPPQARPGKFTSGAVSFKACFVNCARGKYAADCLKTNMTLS